MTRAIPLLAVLIIVGCGSGIDMTGAGGSGGGGGSGGTSGGAASDGGGTTDASGADGGTSPDAAGSFIGTWSMNATSTVACDDGSNVTQPVTGTLIITAGTTSDLVVQTACAFKFDLTSSTTAAVLPNQPCAVRNLDGSTVGIVYTSWIITIGAGRSATFAASGDELVTLPGGTSATCTISQNATLLR